MVSTTSITSGGGPGPLRLVCFELRAQELALPIADVRETLPVPPITRVFLGLLLGLPATAVGHDSKIVVVDCAAGVAGIVVDRLRDLRTIEAALDPPPEGLAPEVAALMLGVVATPTGSVRVLDAPAVLTAAPLRALAQADAEGRIA